jgi:hypothetical protein
MRAARTTLLVTALTLATGGTAASITASAGADPTLHFTGTFVITCGGNTLTLVAKPGSSNVLTVNGQPSNSVSVLLGVTVTENGEVVLDMQKATNNPNSTVCEEPTGVPGETVTVRVINTPPGV